MLHVFEMIQAIKIQKTLRDAKNLRKDDGCFQNGMEDCKRSVWVGGCSPFSANNDLLATWEFELPL